MRILAKLVPALALMGTVTVIHADTDNAAAPTSKSAAAPAKRTVLSPADMTAGSEKIELQLQDDMRSALHLRETARKQKDVIKLNCVNDRLIQIKAQRNIADAQNQELHVALDKNAPETSALYAQLVQTAERVRRLREEASACIGEPELLKQGEAVNEVSGPEIRDNPTETNPFPNTPVNVEPPGYASPFY